MDSVNMRNWLKYLIPAVIAGLLPLIPSAWNYVNSWTNLEYEFQDSPGLLVDGGRYKKIATLRIVNTGNCKLSNIKGYIRIPGGSVEAVNKAKKLLDATLSIKEENEIVLNVGGLLKNEEVTFFMMYEAANQNELPDIQVRSDEVVATVKSGKTSNSYIPLVVSMLAVFAAVIVLKSSKARKFYSRVAIPLDREDILLHIAARFGLLEYYVDYHFGGELKYFRFADISLAIAGRDEKLKSRVCSALKATLHISDIHELSRENILKTLQLLGASLGKDVDFIIENAVSDSSVLSKIDDYIDNVPVEQ